MQFKKLFRKTIMCVTFVCRCVFKKDHIICKFYLIFFAVYPDGRVCISILHTPGDDPMGYETSAERWSPVQSVEKILLSVVSMLAGKITDIVIFCWKVLTLCGQHVCSYRYRYIYRKKSYSLWSICLQVRIQIQLYYILTLCGQYVGG